MNEVLNVKQEESEANIEENKIAITCKYFNSIKMCWFYLDNNHEEDKKIN